MVSLSYLSAGQKAKISGFASNSEVWLRFMEMGLKINEPIQVLGKLPGGSLIILSKHGKYSLRSSSARHIKVDKMIK